MPRPLVALLFMSFLPLAGCGQFPDIQAPAAATATTTGWPNLLPMQEVFANGAAAPAEGTVAQSARQLAARAARLRARRDALMSRPVIEPRIRRHMLAVLARHQPR